MCFCNKTRQEVTFVSLFLLWFLVVSFLISRDLRIECRNAQWAITIITYYLSKKQVYRAKASLWKLFQAVHRASDSHPWAGPVKRKTEWRQMDGWYLFNSLNIELGCTGASSDVIWEKRQNILALCHLFINIINLYYLRNYSKYTRRLRRRHKS